MLDFDWAGHLGFGQGAEERLSGRHDGGTVPRHGTLKRGTLRSILREAKISVEEFVRALAG